MTNSDAYYSKSYDNILKFGLIGALKRIEHKYIESFFPKDYKADKILELGAGNGWHKNFVRHKYLEYIESDLRGNPELGVISVNAENLSIFGSSTFDRVICTCLIAHLNDPKQALREWRRVTRNKGTILIYVPCEPGLFLRLLRFFTTNLKARLKGVDHYSFHYSEHRNYFLNLKYLINNEFSDDIIKVKKFPFKFLSWNLNFFYVYIVTVNR